MAVGGATAKFGKRVGTKVASKAQDYINELLRRGYTERDISDKLGYSQGSRGGWRDDLGADRDLMFMHNTSAEKLARQQEMGGMPMPSIGVTKKDIPFDGFGDISLVGKPMDLDPSYKPNKLYSADAYTVRAPSPVQKAKKNSYKQFAEDFEPYKEAGYMDDARYSLGNLESKRDISESEYSSVERFFEGNNIAVAKFLDEKGIPLPRKPNGDIDGYAMNDLRLSNSDEYKQWAEAEKQKYLEPEKYFISNPDRDRYTTSPRLKPYDADEITKFMKKSSGRGKENTMTTGAGQIRAQTTEQIKTLKGARARKGDLKSAEDVAEMKQTSEMMLDDLQDALKGNYKYAADGWQYRDEVGEMIGESERIGTRRALKEFGFEDVSDELVAEVEGYKNFLRTSPTEYFESKPERVVGLSDFGGAIVPKGTDASTRAMLERAGLRVEEYSSEAGRLAARKKFRDMMFQAAPYATSAGLLGLAASPDNAMAASHGTIEAAKAPWLSQAANYLEMVDTPIGKPFEGIAAWARGAAYQDPDKWKRAAIGALDIAP